MVLLGSSVLLFLFCAEMASAMRIMYSMASQNQSVTAVKQSGTFTTTSEASCVLSAPVDACSHVAATTTSCDWVPSVGRP